MQTSRHWLIGSALGCLLAAVLAVLTDAALPPAAPRPAPLPLPPAPAGHVSPFADLPSATPTAWPVAESVQAQTPVAAMAPVGAPATAAIGPDTQELQALIDDLANHPSADAALDREVRDLLLADVRQRLRQVRDTRGPAAEVAQLERMTERLARLP